MINKSMKQPITEGKWKTNVKKIKNDSRPIAPPPAPQPKNNNDYLQEDNDMT